MDSRPEKRNPLKTTALLQALPPELRDSRGDRRLFVWGALAQWLVVDEELAGLLELFNGRRSLKNVLRAHAKRWHRRPSEVESEAMPIVQDLVERQILVAKGAAPRPVMAEPLRIANLTINITNRCNLRCPWCYNAGRHTAEMPVDTMMDAIEDGREALDKDASLIVLGGEPLLDPPRLLDLLDRAARIFGGTRTVSTNGTLLSPDVANELAQRKVEVQVSLDNSHAAQHDAARGNGTFAKAADGVRSLVDAGAHTILSMVYSRENYRDFEPYLDMALKLGANEARFIPLRAVGGGLEARALLPDQAAAFRHLVGLLDRRPELGTLLRRDYFSILMTVCRHSAVRTCCGIGRRVAFVDADGKVYPCPNHVRAPYLCGDLHDAGLGEIFMSSPVFERLRAEYCVSRYSGCRDCPFRHWCAGDCRGEVLACDGDAFGVSPHCAELREVMTEMLWLVAEGGGKLGAAP